MIQEETQIFYLPARDTLFALDIQSFISRRIHSKWERQKDKSTSRPLFWTQIQTTDPTSSNFERRNDFDVLPHSGCE